MKKKFLLIMFIGLLIFSCKNETELENFSLGFEDNFRFGAEYQSNNNLLKFKITEINDSRCPSDVVCIWAGKTDVKIEVESPVTGTIVLSTYDNPVDTVGNFSFKIIDVLPYPISTKTIQLEDYNVTLKIVELTN